MDEKGCNSVLPGNLSGTGYCPRSSGGVSRQVALQVYLGHFWASQDIPADPIRICIRLHFGSYTFRNEGRPWQDFNCQLNTQVVFQEWVFCTFTLEALQRVGGWERTPK